jgi:regulator of RNase E activity RraA
MEDLELLKELENYDSPSVSSVIAAWPGQEESCAGFPPGGTNWYTDQTLKCVYPELGGKAGIAVTCILGLPDSTLDRLSWADIYRAVARAGAPVILAIKQDFPPKIRGKSSISGGNLTVALQASGAAGVITDGPIRDIDEIRHKNFQYMITGVTAGHGTFSVKAVNTAVHICGMDICPGEVIHMDKNGAVKFPREILPGVLENVKKLSARETGVKERIEAAAGDVERIIHIMEGLEQFGF